MFLSRGFRQLLLEVAPIMLKGSHVLRFLNLVCSVFPNRLWFIAFILSLLCRIYNRLQLQEVPQGQVAPKSAPCPCGAARRTDGMGQLGLGEPWPRFGFLFLSSPCGCAQVFKNSSKALSYLLLSARICLFSNNMHHCSVTTALVVFIFGALTSFGVFVLAEVTLITCC